MNTTRSACFFALFACTALLGLPTLVRADKTSQPDTSSTANAAPRRMRLRIAVDQLKWEETRNDVNRLPADVREGIQSLLLQKLLRSNAFDVLERERTAFQSADQEAAIEANNRAQSPNGGANRPRPQARVAARYLITPTVIGLTSSTNNGGIRILGQRIGDKKETVELRLNIRISDAQSSRLLDSETVSGKQSTKSSGLDLRVGGIDFSNQKYQESAAGKAVEEALEKAVTYLTGRLSHEKWQASVLKQDEVTKRVIINAGSNSGVTEGMELQVLHKSADIEDPSSGEMIPGDEVAVGVIRIERVEKGYAYARVLSGSTFKAGDVARVAGDR